ncbi:zincin, partial [Ascobolus immersus RN42]
LFLLLVSWAYAHAEGRGPLSYFSLIENAKIHTPSQRIFAHTSFDLSFTLHRGRQEVKLRLEPNNDVFHEDTKITYMDEFGNEEPATLKRDQIKVFKGMAYIPSAELGWKAVGSARIMVHEDGANPVFEGSFSINYDLHHVQLRSTYLQTKVAGDPDVEETGGEFMIVFRDSDVGMRLQKRADGEKAEQCGHDGLKFNMDPDHAVRQAINATASDPKNIFATVFERELFHGLHSKRQIFGEMPGYGSGGGINLRQTIGQTAGCPASKRIALVGVAADCNYVSSFPSKDAASKNIISVFNQASRLFEDTFNIGLGLKSLVVSDASCPGSPPASAPYNIPCTAENVNITNRLDLISKFRGTKKDDGLAAWTLMTKCQTGSAVGLAWLGMVCRSEADEKADGSVVSGANVVARTGIEWKVVAHEMGHTFGAVHDCDVGLCSNPLIVQASRCCPLSATTCSAQGMYIMNPSTDDQIEQFSPCTVGNICSAIGRRAVNTNCLTSNRNVQIISENRCGNGIIEEGEECDCGGEEGCKDNTCCNPKTCKFTTNSVCDDSNDDCCSGCQFKAKGAVCRASNGPCDPEEVCSGTEAQCPEDVVKPDGTNCANGMKCASGSCTSRDEQCRLVMGTFEQSNRTSSCSDQGCSITCRAPEFGPGVCYDVKQNYLDGTACNGDGKCKAGRCSGSTVLGSVKSWIDQNKTTVIGVASAVGGVIVLSIALCCYRRCCKPKPKKS